MLTDRIHEQSPTEIRRAAAAKAVYEQDRRGEVLVVIQHDEMEEKAVELGKLWNARERVLADKRAFASACAAQLKTIDPDIERLAAELEYGRKWIPAQTQMDGLFGDSGLAGAFAVGRRSMARDIREGVEAGKAKEKQAREELEASDRALDDGVTDPIAPPVPDQDGLVNMRQGLRAKAQAEKAKAAKGKKKKAKKKAAAKRPSKPPPAAAV